MPQENELLTQVYIKIEGSDATEDMMRDVAEVVVDTSMYLPDMFSIRLEDPTLKWADHTGFDLGKAIEISAKGSDGKKGTLTKGEIVAIEPELDEDMGARLTIRGYDKSHRLNRGKKSRVFKQMKDSDIMSKIAQERGLSVNIDSTSVVNEEVYQYNQTDMEFIQDRARRNGYMAYVEEDKLYFKKAGGEGSAVETLKWGSNLQEFQARVTGAGQVNSAGAYGWDIKQKKQIKSDKSSAIGVPSINGKNGGQASNTAFGAAAGLASMKSARTQAEADILAQSALNESGLNFFQAEGRCQGNPKIRAGKLVKIEGIGSRFSANYLVTRAIHRHDFEGYTTEFEISGYRANTLPQLLADDNAPSPYGVVTGIVTNIKDPDNSLRVKVKFPTIDDTLESYWARVATPMAGNGRGMTYFPEVNDEVLVAFEYNDINKPYIIGSLWNGKDKAPEGAIKDGKVDKRIIKTRSGHQIVLDDTDKKENILIIDKAGQKITIDASNGSEKIEILDKNGGKVIMDAAKKSITIESAQDIKITAKGKLQIDATGGIDMTTKAKMKLEGAGGVDVESKGQTNIKGTTTSVQGSATAEVKSNGMLTVQGTMVKIN